MHSKATSSGMMRRLTTSAPPFDRTDGNLHAVQSVSIQSWMPRSWWDSPAAGRFSTHCERDHWIGGTGISSIRYSPSVVSASAVIDRVALRTW